MDRDKEMQDLREKLAQNKEYGTQFSRFYIELIAYLEIIFYSVVIIIFLTVVALIRSCS